MLDAQGHRARDRVQHRARSTAPPGGWSPTTAARSASTWRWWCRCTAGRIRRAFARARRRARLHPDRRAHPAVQGRSQHLRHRRRRRRPGLEGRLGGPFEGEILAEQHRSFLAGEPLERELRRPHQLLHRDRVPARRCSSTSTMTPNRSRASSRPHRPAAAKESRLNHLGKLLFQWFYWHRCCPAVTSPASARTCPSPANADRPPLSRPTREKARPCPPRPTHGTEVTVNDEGFFADPDQWTRGHGTRARRRGRYRGRSPSRTGRSSSSCGTSTPRRALARPCGCSARPPGSRSRSCTSFPEGPGKIGSEDRRHPQATRLHLNNQTDDAP